MSRTRCIEAVTADARALDAAIRGLRDEDLLAEGAALEELGRVLDARRTAVAAEVQWRSRPQVGEDGLAARRGERCGVDLLTKEFRISSREAKRRISLGTQLAPRLLLTGEETEGRFPAVSAAVTAGEVPLDSARIIVDALNGVRRRADREELAAAERALSDTAGEVAPDLVQVHATVWVMHLDPDGAEPTEAEARGNRSLKLSGADRHGLTTLIAKLPAEEAAELRAAFDIHRRSIRFTCESDVDSNADDGLPQWHEAEGDQRTKAQYDFDVLLSLLRAGVRSEADGTGGSLRTPHEVVTLVTADDLERRQGGGHPLGVLARFSLPTVERLRCGGSSRLLVTGPAGEPLWRGHATRLFTPGQKKTIAARDGGCAWPGCTAPISWCDAHHVQWWNRDTGPTDVDNGVALCSHHHHVIHSTDQWEIRMHRRLPHLVPKGWQGPPLPHHQMQRHPIHTIRDARRM